MKRKLLNVLFSVVLTHKFTSTNLVLLGNKFYGLLFFFLVCLVIFTLSKYNIFGTNFEIIPNSTYTNLNTPNFDPNFDPCHANGTQTDKVSVKQFTIQQFYRKRDKSRQS